MSEINIVLEGKYKDEKILYSKDMLICDGGLIPRYISSYTVIDESNKDQYSFWKGALGVALFGGLGVIAGVKGKKKKRISYCCRMERWREESYQLR